MNHKKQIEIAEAESLKSSTKPKSAYAGSLELTPDNIETIKDLALKLLITSSDANVARCYAQATLNFLVSKNIDLSPKEALNRE